MKRYFSIMILILMPFVMYAQNAESDLKKYYSATGGGSLTSKVAYLDSLQKIYPKDFRFTYEKSIAYIQNEQNKVATEILDSLVASGVRNERVYCLLINCYMEQQKVKKAKATADSAFSVFPNSARVLCECGYVEKALKNEYAAVLDWEEGIHQNPLYSENYIPLMNYNYDLNERIWTLIYGEIYLNISTIERNIEGVSAKAYDAAFSALAKCGDSVSLYRFCTIRRSYIPGVSDTTKYPFTFAAQLQMIHAYNSLCSANNFDKSLKSLAKLFDRFDDAWQKSIYAKRWKNPVFEYHRILKNEGLLEAYIYLMYRAGATEEFSAYAQKNPATMQRLAKFILSNPLKLTEEFNISKINDYQ